MREENPKLPNTIMCEELISNINFEIAMWKVKSNKGCAGIDGKTVYELEEYMATNFENIKSRILARKYRPKPALRVEIPKANGKMRKLGIPTVVDRTVQQAILQVITPIFEETFSDYSYAYRPERSAEDAIRQAQIYMAQGYKYVVDLDLSSYFDTVNHDILMGLVDKTLIDKDIRRLIFSFLKSGVLIDGLTKGTEEGTPQGGVISPILSNIYLTPFDKEMESRGIKFIRFADDIQMYSKSEMASRRVMRNAIKYLEGKLRLKVNVDKTEARSAKGSQMLGFVFTGLNRFETRIRKKDGKKILVKTLKPGYCCPRDKSLKHFKERVIEITDRSRGRSLEQVICELNSFLRGWINYYARSWISSLLSKKLLPWLRRRVRQYAYKLWKTSKSRKHNLRKYGVEEWKLNRLSCSSRSTWKMSMVMNRCMTNKLLFEKMGLLDCHEYYKKQHKNKMSKDIQYIADLERKEWENRLIS